MSRRPLTVVHVLTEPHGGGGVHVDALVAAGTARGDAVSVVVPARRGVRGGVGTADLLRLMRAADVVHCHGARAALVVPPGSGTPLVATTHGLHAIRGATGAARWVARRATRLALTRARLVIAVGEDDAAEVRGLSPALGRRCVLVRNGVARVPAPDERARRRAREELGLDPEAPTLLFVGSLIHQKHPELAIEAVARARRRLPGLRLLMAGSGPLMPALARAPHPGTELLGGRDDVDRLLLACDAVINTSRWEGLSLALLEALWRGRPIIATDAPGNREAVGDAGVVTPADAGACAEAVVALLSSPERIARLRRSARARAERYFDAEAMTAATVALHHGVAGRA